MKRLLTILVGLVLLMVACAPVPAQPPRGMLLGAWFPAVITYTTDNTTTPVVDLGMDYQYLNVYVPTITTGTVQIQVSESYGGTYAVDGQTAVGFSSTSGGIYGTLTIGGYRYIKLVTGAAQEANRTFKVRGYTP